MFVPKWTEALRALDCGGGGGKQRAARPALCLCCVTGTFQELLKLVLRIPFSAAVSPTPCPRVLVHSRRHAWPFPVRGLNPTSGLFSLGPLRGYWTCTQPAPSLYLLCPPPDIFRTPVALSRAYESAELIKACSGVAANERGEFPTTADLPGFPAPQSCRFWSWWRDLS